MNSPNILEDELAIAQANLAKLFSDVLIVDVPSATTDLFETGILDSQKFVELLLHIEEQFDIHIDIEDFELDNFRSLETITTLVVRRRSFKTNVAHSKDRMH